MPYQFRLVNDFDVKCDDYCTRTQQLIYEQSDDFVPNQ